MADLKEVVDNSKEALDSIGESFIALIKSGKKFIAAVEKALNEVEDSSNES